VFSVRYRHYRHYRHGCDSNECNNFTIARPAAGAIRHGQRRRGRAESAVTTTNDKQTDTATLKP
jgi:hypothetical protein